MSLAPQRQTPIPPPLHTMTTPPPLDVNGMMASGDSSSGVSYPTPSSTSAVRPSVSLPPNTAPPPEPVPVSAMDRGRIYRYEQYRPILQPLAKLYIAWMSSNNQLEPACVGLEIRCVHVIVGTSPRDTALLSHLCVQDRRPITPPPCIRLVVKDATTKEELDIKSVFPACLPSSSLCPNRPIGYVA